jgi:uncharacterized protein YcbX
VHLASDDKTFPDDRRFALLYEQNNDKFNSDAPEWLHKQNFLCAFSDPLLMSRYVSEYEIVESDDGQTRRLLTLRERSNKQTLLDKIDLATSPGRQQLADFFSGVSGRKLVCVTSTTSSSDHNHQFGNTSSGVKARGDTRTVHIVNANTVRELSDTLGVPLSPTRFRPNIVLDGNLAPWKEFEWIGKEIQCGQVKMTVVNRTVRCDGVSIDPEDPEHRVLDIPKLLTQHYSQHGPYLGVYAVIDSGGTVTVGDFVDK